MNIIYDMMNLSSTKHNELEYSLIFMINEKMRDWLFVKFHEWAISQGKKVTQADFARYLGVAPSTLSMWINSKQPPDRHSADLIALKLGPEVYKILNITPPPEFIQKLEAIYPELSPDERVQFLKRINELIAEYRPTND